MKRSIKTVFCFILCAFLLAGCSFGINGINNAFDSIAPKNVRGEMKSVTVTPSDGKPAKKLEFENISFTNTEAKIYIIPSDETKVEAVFPEDMEKYGFSIVICEGEIDISAAKQTSFNAENFRITVYANIEEIEISGGIAVEMNAEKSTRVDFDIKGGTSIYVYNIGTESVEIDIAGAASMNLSGKSDYLDIELAGAGAIDAKSLVCKEAEVKISGAGSAEVSVTDDLLADIDGVGALKYYGDPMVRNISGGLTDVEQASKEVYGG